MMLPIRRIAILGLATLGVNFGSSMTNAQTAAPAVAAQGVTDKEIKFGIVAPFSGASRAYGNGLKIGIQTAFGIANDAGGINGRKLTLVSGDDGYEPARTPDALKDLYEKEQVFGFVGNFGTATSAAALPYVLTHRTLYFAPFTGASVTRHDPPDRYVFNYRPSYAEETGAAVRYLVKVRHLRPEQIAVFTQQDGFGDAGYEGVAKAMRVLNTSADAPPVMRLNYPRNTVDVDGAVAQLMQNQRARGATPIRAVVMVATTRPAAKFIEKMHDQAPGMIYTNVSAVGSSALSEELLILGPKFTSGVIVTQVVPPVEGYASVVLDYKTALKKYFPDSAPDYISFEGYLEANILIEGLRKAAAPLDTEKLVTALESLSNVELGLGTPVAFSRADHQALHKVWGTQMNATGGYEPIDLE